MYHIIINIGSQQLHLYKDDQLFHSFSISSAAKGVGQEEGSFQTPLGKHRICEKLGGDAEPNTVFVSRVPTGEVYSETLKASFPDRDWILTRILRLEGLEPGVNQGGNVDSKNRYIYIHGTPDSVQMGFPGSHGCIRMRNQDVITLFDLVPVNTLVTIES